MAQHDKQPPYRIIFVHKHATSARTRFLRFAANSVCGFGALPKLSQLLDTASHSVVATHPAQLLREAAGRLSLPVTSLVWEPEFNMWVDIPGGPIRILLFRFLDIDPPFAAAEALGGRFIDITEARDLPNVELLLLRRAYEVLLGG